MCAAFRISRHCVDENQLADAGETNWGGKDDDDLGSIDNEASGRSNEKAITNHDSFLTRILNILSSFQLCLPALDPTTCTGTADRPQPQPTLAGDSNPFLQGTHACSQDAASVGGVPSPWMQAVGAKKGLDKALLHALAAFQVKAFPIDFANFLKS